MTYFAHSANASGQWQPLSEHLTNVSSAAAAYADAFGHGEEARLAGLLHDAGKYSHLFQERLAGRAHGLDHWSIGASIALVRYKSVAAALAIQGHHVGLQCGDPDSLRALAPDALAASGGTNHARLTEAAPSVVVNRMREDGFDPVSPQCRAIPRLPTSTASAMLDARMLFSSLVDADFLDTESHFSGARAPGSELQAQAMLSAVEDYVQRLNRECAASTEIRQVRRDLWNAALSSGAGEQGIWTLTAPTGSGKTLAMLGFALRHAIRHGLRRIVVVLPYLSIIDQTARVYHELFDGQIASDVVLEHHSLAGPRSQPERGRDQDAEDPGERRRRELAENWDAPLVVTTSVQMLESLFADRPSACRKLHRLARSVILFDEVQTLPIHLVVPTLKTLSRMAQTQYGSTVVLATATQPAFDHLDPHIAEAGNAGWSPREAVPVALNLSGRSRRVEVDWSAATTPVSWSGVADRLETERQILCIVNLKRHAKTLAEALAERSVRGLRHLSTNMCPAHRRAVIEDIRGALSDGAECRLVSTQCIEAGVDLSCPLVLRVFADLVSITQAAGRSNRNGEFPFGRVEVFTPNLEDEKDRIYPSAAYEQAAAVTRMMLQEHGPEAMDINDPALFREFYTKLYDFAKPETLRRDLREAIERQDYAEVARHYRLIDETAVNVLVPYAPLTGEFEALANEVRHRGLTGGWIRRARPLTVSVFVRDSDPIHGYLEAIPVHGSERSDHWFIYLKPEYYSGLLGLVPPAESHTWLG